MPAHDMAQALEVFGAFMLAATMVGLAFAGRKRDSS